jgi:hypothetical protein
MHEADSGSLQIAEVSKETKILQAKQNTGSQLASVDTV